MLVQRIGPRGGDYDVFPCRATEGSAGYDLVADIETIKNIQPGERVIVPTGVAIALPEGCVGLLFSRSGLATSTGLAMSNSVGVIDSDYRGEVCCGLINHGDATVSLAPGMRIAQLVIVSFHCVDPALVDKLPDTNRGRGGFGSTGKYALEG